MVQRIIGVVIPSSKRSSLSFDIHSMTGAVSVESRNHRPPRSSAMTFSMTEADIEWMQRILASGRAIDVENWFDLQGRAGLAQ
jgi:hypothetical protein